MFCNQCGARVADGSRFCSSCGAKLSTVQLVQPQTDSYFDIRHGVLVKYRGREKNVVVPAGVVEIEANAFTGYDMESITFPEGCKIIRINTFVQRINFPSRIESFSLACGDSKKLDSITIPEGCVSVSISCFVKTIRLPSTVQTRLLRLSSGHYGPRGESLSADDIFFAPGTRVIAGGICGFPNLHIPTSVTEISEALCQKCVYYDEDNSVSHMSYYGNHLICASLNNYTPEVRKVICKYKGLCTNCGGEFVNTVVLGKFCRSCGKPKEYYSEWRDTMFGVKGKRK